MKLSTEPTKLVTRNGLIRGGVFILVLAALPGVFPQHWLWNLFFFTLLYATMAVSWTFIGGFGGYPSLGHAAFFGIGAYAEAFFFKPNHLLHSGYEPLFMLPVIGIICALLAIPIGMLAMRTRADVFAIVTITLLFVTQTLAYNLKNFTGGAQGAAVVQPKFDVKFFELPFYYTAAILLLFAFGLSYYLSKSKIGLSLTAIRADEDKAKGVGVRTLQVKLIAFSSSVAFTGMAGAAWAFYIGFIYPQFAIDPLVTITMVLMTFLGGRATLWGPVLGAAILMPAQQLLAYYVGGSQLYLLAYAAIFLVTILFLPRGILPTVTNKRRLKALALKSVAAKANDPLAEGQSA